MEGNNTEKSHGEESTRTSSRGGSSDDNRLAHKEEKSHSPDAPSEEVVDLKKLDSKLIHVEVHDEDPFKHLPADEKEILKRQVDVPDVKAGVGTIYRYATRNDFIIIAISAFCAIAGGAALPLMTVCL